MRFLRFATARPLSTTVATAAEGADETAERLEGGS